MSSAVWFNMDQSKIVSSANGLNVEKSEEQDKEHSCEWWVNTDLDMIHLLGFCYTSLQRNGGILLCSCRLVRRSAGLSVGRSVCPSVVSSVGRSVHLLSG